MHDTSNLSTPCWLRKRAGLPNAMRKLAQPEREVVVAYLGGSITDANQGYRDQTLSWLEQRFPAAVRHINAGVGGTGSDLGVFRLDEDVLAHRPDLLFIEFAVNDFKTDPVRIRKAMEGIVRKTRTALPQCDICFVYTITELLVKETPAGEVFTSLRTHEEVAAHYDIPSINMGVPVLQLLKKNKLVLTVPPAEKETVLADGKVPFTPDTVHPYPEGQQVYANAIIHAFGVMQEEGREHTYTLPAPLVADHWQDACALLPDSVTLHGPWTRLYGDARPPVVNQNGYHGPIWKGEPGAVAEFSFEGIAFGLIDIIGPDVNQIRLTVDGEAPEMLPRFDRHCIYNRIGFDVPCDALPRGRHTVRIEVTEELLDKTAIMAENTPPRAPDAPESNVFYLGKILIAGSVEQ